MANAPERRGWEIELTPQAKAWLGSLNPDDAAGIGALINKLERHGAALKRPDAAAIKSSRHQNMRELRLEGSSGQHFRALFALDDRRRRGIVLLGGDKTNDWIGWYLRNVPKADKVHDQYLRATGRGNQWQKRATRAGTRSAVSSR